jgi:putative transposase
MPRTRRNFTPHFKAQVVLDLLAGTLTQAEICRQHNLKPQLLANWKTTVIDGLPSLFQEPAIQDPQQARIAELEQLLGRQAYELEVLKKVSRLLPGPSPTNGRSS